jgi:hypothetical protein
MPGEPYFMGERDRWFDRIRARYRLEHGLILGGGITLTGLAIGTWIVIAWINRGFGPLSEENLVVLAATFIIIGVQVFFSSFLLSILGLRRRDNSARAPVSRLSDTSRNPPAPAMALVVNRSDRSRE